MENLSLRERFFQDLQLKGFAQSTKKLYLSHVVRYVKAYGKNPEVLGEKHIKNYLLKLVESNRSTSYINQAYSALRFLYETTMKREWETFKIPRSKQHRRLPVALTQYEIKKLLTEIKNVKHRAIFELIYCGGLRVGEAVMLKVHDINSKNMSIYVHNGKGKKDRYTLLSHRALKTLKIYYHTLLEKPKWLFPGQNINTPISKRSVQKVFGVMRAKIPLNPRSTVHSIRHSFATHNLEAGVDVYHLQKLMGHTDVKTTSKYLHISNVKAIKIISPHDALFANND